MSADKLANFLREASNWSWEEFAKAEKNPKFTTNESVIFSLIRACAMQNLSAIKMSLNRIDGKLKTPIKIEYPKVFYLYPNASVPEKLEKPKTAEDPTTVNQVEQIMEGGELTTPEPIEQPKAESEADLPSMGLRETLIKMADYPRELPQAIVDLALQTEQWIRKAAPKPDEIPKVKSVVAAHLLIMAQNRNIDALTEVFDQIDGKLVETLQIIGEDMYLASYSDTPPEGAYLNKDGIWEIEAVSVQNMWAEKLGKVIGDDK
jgi:hypothetical protein